MPNATERTPLSIEEFQAKAADLVKEVAKTREAIPVAVGDKAVAVLLDLETYHYHIHLINFARALLEAEADIRAGKTRPAEEFFEEIMGEERRAPKVPRGNRSRRRA
jgi:PHD/YefM family antitoxin component YafN of YafNO toxin-antitoxin module